MSMGSPYAYPNETKEQTGVVGGVFHANLTVKKAGMVYLRAHATINNVSYYSDEVTINVTAPPAPKGTTFTVTIGATTPSFIADYKPSALSIKKGDSVVWKNLDAAGVGHTATSTSGTPSFDTGTIAATKTSKPVYFNTAGTWSYHCTVHSTMSAATITVT
jgi:plastocyanin